MAGPNGRDRSGSDASSSTATGQGEPAAASGGLGKISLVRSSSGRARLDRGELYPIVAVDL